VIRGEKTKRSNGSDAGGLAKQIGKTPIVVKDGPGFLVNRILFPYIDEAILLLEEGAEPRAVDKAATAFGMPMGPITLLDVVGLDTALYAGRVMHAAFRTGPFRRNCSKLWWTAGRPRAKSGAGLLTAIPKDRGV